MNDLLRTGALGMLGFFSAAVNSQEVPMLERVGVTGAFAVAVSVQYWENRKKDSLIQANLEKQAVQNERMISILEDLREEIRVKK